MSSSELSNRHARFGQIDLYPVTCEPLSNGRTDIEVLQACMDGGARLVQLRDKKSSKKVLYKKAESFRKITEGYGALLIINDHVDIALSINADGVHLGQDDFPLKAARNLAADLILGRSCHSWKDVETAVREGVSYVNVGPVYATTTKSTPVQPLGLDLVRRVAEECPVPFTVMGGIKEAHVLELVEAGATKIALVTAITQAEDMVQAVKDLRSKILSNRVK